MRQKSEKSRQQGRVERAPIDRGQEKSARSPLTPLWFGALLTTLVRSFPSVLRLRTRREYLRALWSVVAIFGALLFGLQTVGQPSATNERSQGVVLSLEGAVTPTVADYLSREISAASQTGKDVIILEIDTPGGLVDSMKTIIKSILASEVPVVTFVSPQGARSASAGVYIMYAAHVSAMAPATNTGSATPITMGGSPGTPERDTREPVEDDPAQSRPNSEQPANEAPDEGDDTAERVRDALETIRPSATPSSRPLSNDDAMRAKMVNDAVAYIRSLAELRGRNADWAESAVRNAANVPASEALALNVIDLIADDMDDLLTKIDGTVVRVASGEVTIRTEGIELTRIAPTWFEKVLGFFANPNVAAILMTLGTTGIIIEMWNPGSVFPGVVGLISLLLGLYSFQVLPFSWLGIALIVAGIVFMVLEAYTPTFGVIGLIGLICFGFGLFMVFPEEFRVSSHVVIAAVGFAGAFMAMILFAVVGSRGHGPMIGGDAIRRREGVVSEWDGLEGHVIVEGERWRARSSQPLKAGDRIKVTDVDGLVLVVRRAKAESGLLGGAKASEV